MHASIFVVGIGQERDISPDDQAADSEMEAIRDDPFILGCQFQVFRRPLTHFRRIAFEPTHFGSAFRIFSQKYAQLVAWLGSSLVIQSQGQIRCQDALLTVLQALTLSHINPVVRPILSRIESLRENRDRNSITENLPSQFPVVLIKRPHIATAAKDQFVNVGLHVGLDHLPIDAEGAEHLLRGPNDEFVSYVADRLHKTDPLSTEWLEDIGESVDGK
jgi:hypothetical protein